MSNFLSFAPAAALANALKVVEKARERMAKFDLTIPITGEETQKKDDNKQAKETDEEEDESESESEASESSEEAKEVSLEPGTSKTHTDDDDDGAPTNDTLTSLSLPMPIPPPSIAPIEAASHAPSTALTQPASLDAPIGMEVDSSIHPPSSTSVASASRKRKADTDLTEDTTHARSPTHSAPTAHTDEMATESAASHSSTSEPTTAAAAARPIEPTPVCSHYESRGPSWCSVRSSSGDLPSFSSLDLARSWPFTLDEFQQRSISVLENHQHVMVAAHTSAGKTVIAEYAVAMVFRENKRARERAQLQAAGSREAQQASTLPPVQKRVIYTAPIKALSNQKYREFKEIFNAPFEDVGLMTGDVMLNPNATCLIMTTEILRSMLYNGSETLADTSIVIFDEIHYMKDVERGIIWEESIIMLPSHIQCVFLSATLSNSEEFAEWIHEIKAEQIREEIRHGRETETHADTNNHANANTNMRNDMLLDAQSKYHTAVCHVVYTNTRPIPLSHYLFLKGGQGIYQIKNDARQSPSAPTLASSKSTINMSNLRKIQSEIREQERIKHAMKSKFGELIREQHAAGGNTSANMKQRIHDELSASRAAKRSEIPDLVRLVTLAVEQDWLPLIVFSFSRRECEHLSLTLGDKKWCLDLTSVEEKSSIQMVWDHAMSGLEECDKELPQLSYLLPLLIRGIAVHHSGLLPILKELIEILFQEGLVKVLCATETFAMGLNMPARSVVFTTLEKFDGRVSRYLMPGEYTQMAGRAGRRGQDSKGIVIMMVGSKEIEASVAAKALAEGTSAAEADTGEELGGMLSHILTGSSDPLQSKFRLTYNMILNLIRCSSSFDPTYILSKSFLHFQQKHLRRYRKDVDHSILTANSKSRTPLTSVSGKRARMGEGGIASLAAAGAEMMTKHDEAKSQVEELQEELEEIDHELQQLTLTTQQRSQIDAFQLAWTRMLKLQHEQYLYSLRHPIRCMLPFMASGRLVYIRSPAIAGTNTTAQSESRPGQPAQDWGWGIVIHWRMRHTSRSVAPTETRSDGTPLPNLVEPPEYVVDVLLPVGLKSTVATDGTITWTENVQKWGEVLVPIAPKQLKEGPQANENGTMQLDKERNTTTPGQPSASSPLYHIVNCSLSMIHSISSVRLYLPPSLLLAPSPSDPDPQAVRHALFTVLANAARNFPQESFPKIGTRDWSHETQQSIREDGGPAGSEWDGTQTKEKWLKESMKIEEDGRELSRLETSLLASPVHTFTRSEVESYIRLNRHRTDLLEEMSSHTSTLSTTYLTSYRIELHTRLRILRRFGHLSSAGLITGKGRIAAEIESTDELLITEFIYEGHWKSLSTAELIAILTAFLDVERSNANRLTIPTAELQKAYGHIQSLARNICAVSNECGLILDSARYLSSFKHDLIPIAYRWMNQPDSTFASLLTQSDLFEGTLIRIFRRLDEFLNQLIKAAKNIGEHHLLERLEEGQKRMKKGIMFTGSLYI